MDKKICRFEDGNAKQKHLLGGKGAGLAAMTQMGLPVPPGFTITTRVCREYYEKGRELPPDVWDTVLSEIKVLEDKLNKVFGSKDNPLLLSVRSGAPLSMPGMMDTILNLGLNDNTVEGLAKLTANDRFAWDSYRRFLQSFGKVVLDVPGDLFEEAITHQKVLLGIKDDSSLASSDLKELVKKFKKIINENSKIPFPEDSYLQLKYCIKAVFESWNGQRAIEYRRIYNIPETLGTAVNIMVMVFGNMGMDSATGVAFTRDPSTGEKKFFGEFLPNAQGEDVVAGIRTPQEIELLARDMPQVYSELLKIAQILENTNRDMQDIEFTIEKGKLFMLQTRVGKRTPMAAIKIAVDMVNEKIITKDEAILRVTCEEIEKVLHPSIDPRSKVQVIAKGLPASPGAAVGEVVFDADKAVKLVKEGHKIILVRPETTPDDVHGIYASQGVLTSRGGMTSHAAVVTRGMGKPCIVGCEEMKIDLYKRVFTVGDISVYEGDIITIEGGEGKVILGEAPLVMPELGEDFKKLLQYADEFRRLRVHANADTPEDAVKAREFGAQGIGLARTEHMFLGPDRVPIVQEMIMAPNNEERNKALLKLLKVQREDFIGILKAMDSLPVTIRLLDPPLHEFLPAVEDLSEEIRHLKAQNPGEEEIKAKEILLKKAIDLKEFNPMLGWRGCRLGIVLPEIYEMQVRAIFEAAAYLVEEGNNPIVEVMHPLVGIEKEMDFLSELTHKIARETMETEGVNLNYKVGTMIEIPRAALIADKLAEKAEFFSFGTNDLTQMTFGFSRDDAERKFIPYYLEHNILENNPFEVLDFEGVGKLMELAVKLGKNVRSNMKIGICGEHGGNPKSVEFCHRIGLDYVSCSPFRVPIARFAAAQAFLKEKTQEVSSSV
ncbi:MAG: Pyruvate, phosphate dikinase [candidate division WS2 bacterium]|nr:Pyruvate, phosphate dikinase [Candidatus Lithacetigena glycinireducens]